MVIVFHPHKKFTTKLKWTICLHFVDLDFVIFGQAFDTEPFSSVTEEAILSHGFHSRENPTLASPAMLFYLLRDFRKI